MSILPEPRTHGEMGAHIVADHELPIAYEVIVAHGDGDPVGQDMQAEHAYAHKRDQRAGVGHYHEEDTE